MTRNVVVAAAQMGPVALNEKRTHVIARMKRLMSRAKSEGSDLVVFPELALTTFFPRWYFEEQADVDRFFERSMPSESTLPLFEHAAALRIAFCFGFAELVGDGVAARRYNTSILVDQSGLIIGKYRKIHLPGHQEHEPQWAFQHLEKRYFDTGDLGFQAHHAMGGIVGMAICNDRRWPETYRVLGLQDVELIVLGYNTPVHNPEAPELDHLASFHNRLVMQAGAYQNGSWVVGVAKAGCEEGCDQIGDSMIIAPSGEVVARCSSLDDEIAVAACDLDMTLPYKRTIFNFAEHREPEAYRLIVERKGAVPPPHASRTL